MRYLLILLITLHGCVSHAQPAKIQKLKITILSTMLADVGIGEWGFCALIEFDNKKILFDTGARPETVLSNAREMNIDLSDITEVFISHSHGDHTGGLMTLRNTFSKKNPRALSLVHIGEGAFYARPDNPEFTGFLTNLKRDYEQSGGRFMVYQRAEQIYPGVWITGPVPRKHDERNWSGTGKVATPKGVVEDNVPEDQSLIFDTSDGLIIVSGCGHSGIINTLEYSQQITGSVPVHTLIGGFHLFHLSDERMRWTTGHLKPYAVKNIIGAHCTGINALFDIQRDLSLDRAHAVVGAVGAVFELGKGINPGQIAR